jgi:tripartite ATP-independent transporter DctP family solute receptor
MMVKKNGTLYLFFVGFFILVPIFGLQAAEKPIVMRAGGISPPASDISICMVQFTKFFEEQTKGKAKIEFYPASILGSAPNQIENVQSGSQDIFNSSIGWVTRQIPDFTISQMPYAFRNQEHLTKFIESPLGQEYQKTLISKWNTRILSYNWWRLPRVIFAKKPIFKIEDVKGLKFRIAELPMYPKYVSAWGAVPTRIAWGEYYLALKQGVVDMGESCAENIYPMKLYEAAPYITMINYAYDLQYMAMNEKRFQSLSPDIQKALIDSANKAGNLFTQTLSGQFEKDKAKMIEEGAAFIEVSSKPFKDRMVDLVKDLEKENFWSKGLYEKVQQIK